MPKQMLKIFLLIQSLYWTSCFFPQSGADVIAKYDDEETSAKTSNEPLKQKADLIDPKVKSLCENEAQLSKAVTLSFPSTIGEECNWSEHNTLPRTKLGHEFSALRDHVHEFSTPVNHKLCGIQFESVGGIQRYNDALIILLNDRFLASRAAKIESKSSLAEKVLDLEAIQSDEFLGLTQSESTYCAPGTKCEIPRTQSGKNLKIRAELKYFAHQESRINHELKLILTGNRSIVDCQHTGIQLSMRYTYVEVPEGEVAH